MTAPQRYIALLRGINVGGNAKLSMAQLKLVLADAGFGDVSTYINSGNVLFSSVEPNTSKLTALIHDIIQDSFGLSVDVVILTKAAWIKIIQNAPDWWGRDGKWKHNLLVTIPPATPQSVAAAMDDMEPKIEQIELGDSVLYQSLLSMKFGQTSSSKLITKSIYKQLTIRNYNTSVKLLALLNKPSPPGGHR